MKEKFLTPYEVEDYTNGILSEALLRNWRCMGRNKKELPYTKVARRIYYKPSEIDRFLNSCSSGKQQLPKTKTS